MTAIGFIGLGVMGGPMAANLVRAGFDVAGFNRSPAKVQRLVDVGGRGAASAVAAAEGADVVITVLPDSPTSRRCCWTACSTCSRPAPSSST